MTTDQKVDVLSRRLDEVVGYLKETLGFGKDKSRTEFRCIVELAVANAANMGVSNGDLASILREEADRCQEIHLAFR